MKLGRLEHDLAEPLEGGPVATLAVDELGVVDGMRLLPDEERADARRRLRAAGARHLRPPGAGVALAPGGPARTGKDALVVPEAALEQREAPPEREVRRVPPVHLQVELALPAVEREPGLLRRIAPGTLDRGEVLGQHDPPLQLAPAGLAASREVDRAPGRPEAIPVPLRGPARLLERGKGLRRRRGGEGHDRFQGVAVSSRLEEEEVPLLLGDRPGGGPGEPDAVPVGVESPQELGAPGVGADHRRLVSLGPRPVGRRGVPRAVGEAEAEGQPSSADQGGDGPHRDEIEVRMAERLDLDGLALQPEAAPEDAVPEVEGLLDVRHVLARRLPAVGEGQPEADAAEVEAVGVGAEPLDLGRPAIARDVRVPHLSPVRGEFREVEALDRPALRVGRRVPAPLRERAEGDRVVVGLGERLEPGRVGGEGELPVADGQRRLDVEGAQGRVVASHQGAAVDHARGRFSSFDGMIRDPTPPWLVGAGRCGAGGHDEGGEEDQPHAPEYVIPSHDPRETRVALGK